MRFHFLSVLTKVERTETIFEVAVGNKICGLSKHNSRPQTVELNYDELMYLLRNQEYAVKNVLVSLAMPEKKWKE